MTEQFELVPDPSTLRVGDILGGVRASGRDSVWSYLLSVGAVYQDRGGLVIDLLGHPNPDDPDDPDDPVISWRTLPQWDGVLRLK